MSGTITMTSEEYDALHAEADSLRAESQHWKKMHAGSMAMRMSVEFERDEMRTELEAARGLLEQRIPCDVMLPPATTIKRGCPLSTVLASMKLREDVPPNQRVFTATPAPEVHELAKQALSAENQRVVPPEPIIAPPHPLAALAEQGERQEAACWVPRACLDKLRNGRNNSPTVLTDGPAEFNDTPLYTTPQPGQDVRGLAAFALELIDGAWEGASFDGGDVQEAGVRHGLLVVERREESCGEHCSCAEHGFPIECYRLTPALAAQRQAQQGDSHDA